MNYNLPDAKSNCEFTLIYLVWGWASFLIRQPVGIDGEAEGGPLDTVLRLGLVELVAALPLLLLLPLLPLLPPVAALLGALGAQLRRPRGGLGGGVPSPAVLAALGGCCRGNLPANESTGTVVMATWLPVSEGFLAERRGGQRERQRVPWQANQTQTPKNERLSAFIQNKTLLKPLRLWGWCKYNSAVKRQIELKMFLLTPVWKYRL